MTIHEPTFRHVLGAFLAELTPQPWEYTAPDGTTLTVIPARMRADRDCAEVFVRVTVSHTEAAWVGITTADMPSLIDALDKRTAWTHDTILGDIITVLPDGADGFSLAVTEEDTIAAVHLPASQRLPLKSALERATDVARGWEDEA